MVVIIGLGSGFGDICDYYPWKYLTYSFAGVDITVETIISLCLVMCRLSTFLLYHLMRIRKKMLYGLLKGWVDSNNRTYSCADWTRFYFSRVVCVVAYKNFLNAKIWSIQFFFQLLLFHVLVLSIIEILPGKLLQNSWYDIDLCHLLCYMDPSLAF